MTDILKKPVHLAIIKQTHLDKLAANGKITGTKFGINPINAIKLPIEKKEKISLLPKVEHINVIKQHKLRINLQVWHDSHAPPTPTPPCNDCKTAACCRAFAVNITEEEYKSGLYGDNAVQINQETYKQLQSRVLIVPLIGFPPPNSSVAHYLEGKVGEPCPFLTVENRCGIYDIRPSTCRSYSCVLDKRITESMRQGTEIKE